MENTDSDDGIDDEPEGDDFGMDEDTNRSNTVSTVIGPAPSQGRGDSKQRKGRGHQTAMQGDQHAGRGSSRGGGRTGKQDGNKGKGNGKAGRGAIREEANTANPNTSSA